MIRTETEYSQRRQKRRRKERRKPKETQRRKKERKQIKKTPNFSEIKKIYTDRDDTNKERKKKK